MMKLFFLESKFRTLLLLTFIVSSLFTISCNKDDDGTTTPTTEDGIYIKGPATAFTDFKTAALMVKTRNEVLNAEVKVPRESLLELYIPVKAGSGGFNIVQVAGTTKTTYGAGTDFAKVDSASLDVDEPKEGLWKGNLVETTAPFVVPEDGLYHVIVDLVLKKVAVARVKYGVIGGATPGGWSTNTPMTAAFNLNKMVFEVSDVLMLKNDWKFRYSNGWKIFFDKTTDVGFNKKGVSVNTNLGGAVNALVAGGDNISNAVYAIYKFTLTYEVGKGFTATQEKTGEGPTLAQYPEKLYMIGDGVGGWDWATIDLPMVPVHSHPELFWKIVKTEGTGAFKFAPGREWKGDFGKTGSATNGVFAKGSDNVDVPATAGFYLVVVNLKDETIEVVPAAVYGIGDCFGGYDPAKAENKFNSDASSVSLTKALLAGDLRFHVAASTLKCDWWQAEFMVLNGKIEYRGTGNDQTRVNVTAGSHTITLDFKANTGSVN